MNIPLVSNLSIIEMIYVENKMLPYNIDNFMYYLNLVILTLLHRQQKVDQYSLKNKVKVIQLVRMIYSQCEIFHMKLCS